VITFLANFTKNAHFISIGLMSQVIPTDDQVESATDKEAGNVDII